MGAAASEHETVDVSAYTAKEASWWAAVPVGGKVYCLPHNADHLLTYDPDSLSVSALPVSAVAKGGGKWRSAVVLGGTLYGIPDQAECLLLYSLATGKVSGIPTSRVARGERKWQSAVVLGGKIYAIPFHADKMLVYDPATRQASGLDITDLARGPAKWLASAVLGGRVYGVPCNASVLLVYDPVSRSKKGIDISHVATGGMKWLSTTVVGGKLYAIPCHADTILVYDPATEVASGVSTLAIAAGPGKWLSAVSCQGKVYGIPDHADCILSFNPEVGNVQGVDVSAIASGPYKWQSAIVHNHRIFAAPHNADVMLVFDPSRGTVVGVPTDSVASGPGKWGTTVNVGGQICCIPWDAQHVLVHSPPKEEPLPASLPPAESIPADMREQILEDFVGAWLSEWVYHLGDPSIPDEIPPLNVASDPVKFHVHGVYEEPMEGTPARLATVTVELPRRSGLILSVVKVTYLVFKGTSFITDFITNASLAPDFAPFHSKYAECTTFVHRGAYATMTQLRVHYWQSLVEHLTVAAQSLSSSKLLVTGHSLGGQYAMAFLAELFLSTVQPPLPLSSTVRCIAFAAPMCYGSAEGHDVKDEFARFVKSRAVNYVFGGDPVPRLWSELDLEGFMRFFADRVRGQIPSTLRPLVDWAAGPGGIAQRVEELLQRPDISAGVLRPASRYVHLAEIRLLGRRHMAWRPLGQDGIVLEAA